MLNHSFESYNVCPYTVGYFNRWGVHNWWGFDTSFTGYYNGCYLSSFNGPGVPKNDMGNIFPKTGNAYVSIGALSFSQSHNNAREYIQGKFSQALLKDSLYCVSYLVNNCGFKKRAINSLNAYINDTLLNWNNGYFTCLKNINPQIQCGRFLKDTAGWEQVCGIYKAKGGELYITLGNFKNDAQTQTIDIMPNNGVRIDYVLDDVSVSPFHLQKPNLGRDTILCPGALPFTLTAPLGYDSVVWSNGSKGQQLLVNTPGKYWVKCIANGCGATYDTISITTFSLQSLKLPKDTILCKGQQITLTSNATFNAYNWSNGSTSNSIVVTKTGTYSLSVSDKCQTQSASIKIVFDSVPNIAISIGKDTTLCQNGYNTPYTISASPPTLPNFNWSTGQTQSAITVAQEGNYQLTVNYRCGSLKSNWISVYACPPDTTTAIWLPNSFSPDGNGLNDVWQPIYTNKEISLLKIYNRWGECVFTGTTNNKFTWDGTYKNEPCKQDVYAYIICYTSNGAAKKTITQTLSGNINLMR
ncbi:MAG: gliding motility-associated C-terminal domain-containing protein [Bacteroidetes bacterium]|nr:gliding motility-associated C-terminal domain-containing protein [Bacteroidota bacterium]